MITTEDMLNYIYDKVESDHGVLIGDFLAWMEDTYGGGNTEEREKYREDRERIVKQFVLDGLWYIIEEAISAQPRGTISKVYQTVREGEGQPLFTNRR